MTPTPGQLDAVFLVMLFTRNNTGTVLVVCRTQEEAEAATADQLREYGLPGFYTVEVHRMRFGTTVRDMMCARRLTRGGDVVECQWAHDYPWPTQAEFDAALEATRVKP